mmetsp:Transcript_17485/g.30141  ORF Transcript_17485/g.30141 Transcript_17485/m.30141 type:complete len:89 (-) Transcript_17485:687-953(-)
MFADKVVGGTLLLISVSVYVYYTIWVIVVPLVEKDPIFAPFLQYFPPQYYAVAIPVALLLLLFTAVSMFLGVTMLKQKRKLEAKKKST